MLINFLNFDAGWSHSYFISIFESHCNKNYPLCLKAAVPFLEALEEFFSWCIMFLPIFLIYFRYKSEIFQFEQSRKVWLIFISWREAYTFFFSGNDIFLSTNLCKIFSKIFLNYQICKFHEFVSFKSSFCQHFMCMYKIHNFLELRQYKND